jgi:hypothetical protein
VGGWRRTLFGARRPWARVRSPRAMGEIGSRLLHATAVKAAALGRQPFEGFLLTQLEVLGEFAGGGGAARRWCSSSAAWAAVAHGRGRPGTLGARPLGCPGRHKVAATPMTAWGERVAPRHIRFVYSREPVQPLSQLGSACGQRWSSSPEDAHHRVRRDQTPGLEAPGHLGRGPCQPWSRRGIPLRQYPPRHQVVHGGRRSAARLGTRWTWGATRRMLARSRGRVPVRYKVGAEQLQQVPSLVHRPDTVFQAARTAPVGPPALSAPPPARSPAGSRPIGSRCWTKTGRPTALARSAPAASPLSSPSARRYWTSRQRAPVRAGPVPSSSTGIPTGQRVPSEVGEECSRRPVMAAPVHVRSRSGWLVSVGTSIQQPAGDGGKAGGGRA